MAKKYPQKREDFTYSCPIVEEFGAFPVVYNQVKYWVVMALVRAKDLFFDPKNPRLWNEDVKGNYSNAGQKRLCNKLKTGDLEGPATTLQKQMEANGGQNEALWVWLKDGQATVVEGNRRLSISNGLDGWEKVLVHIFPDQMSKDHVEDAVEQRHVSGIENWGSVIRSEAAYKHLIERRMDIQEIVARLGFTSVKTAEKFIHAFVWWKASGLDKRHWSKFYHLYVPRTVNHFGYDKNHWVDGSKPFKEELRKPASKDGPSPQEVDKIIAQSLAAATGSPVKQLKSDFYWACKLIENGQFTDCRQGDGVIGPILAEADQPYGPEVLRILQSKPKNKRSKDEDHDDGVGLLDPDTPAQMAWNYLRDARQGNHLVKKVQGLSEELAGTMNSVIRMEKYIESSPENQVLRGTLIGLQGQLALFLKKMKTDD